MPVISKEAMMFGWTARGLLARARKAGRARDWRAAAQAYAGFLDRRPDHAAAWVQLGHALKEQGDFAGARAAYDRAVGLDPAVADSWLQRGHILKLLGERASAIDAYAAAAALDPQLEPAAVELIAMGARDRLPETSLVHGQADPYDLARDADFTRAISDQRDETCRPGIVPPSRYNTFRRQLVIARPPDVRSTRGIDVIVDAREALPVEVRVTLSSLLDQVEEQWRTIVLAPPAIRDHSVASLQSLDARITFVDPASPCRPKPDGRPMLLLTAGVVLDRHAIGWFALAVGRTGCVAAYCDDDRSIDDWREGRRFEAPRLQPMYDPIWFAQAQNTPAAVLVDSARLHASWEQSLAVTRRQLLAAATEIGGVAHLPLLLATVKGLPREAETAMADPEPTDSPTAVSPGTPAMARPPGAPERIQVIIQTRDEPELLQSCVASLRKRAVLADLLDITVVDNRSTLPATHKLLNWLQGQGVNILTLDAPFNWSHANNLAAEDAAAPLLLFVNNDTEMLTDGWDEMLRSALVATDVGVVGALLFYPDRTIQHAGMIFGMGAGGPVHEGVGRKGDDPGPTGRWALPRSASAVTGAFMAMRRTVFDVVGRFDAKAFSIAFNDVDLCLRVRAAGFRILQTPLIALIHYESKTRGMNATRSRIAWDLEELTLLHRRWGAELFADPAYNPHWTRTGLPFDGYRFPGLREIVHHIDRSARPQPWRVSAGGGDDVFWW